MTTKEAITWARKTFDVKSWPEVGALIAALLASQKREREVWNTMSDFCGYRATWCKEALCKHYMVAGGTKCTRRTCPLLKQKKEIK